MMGRECRITIRSAVFFGLTALVSAGCEGTAEDDEYGPLIYDDLPATALGPFATSVGFAGGTPYEYLDLGPINTVVPKVYIMRGVEGQYPIVDTLPGNGDYSPFWQVVEVSPPGGYKANQIKSYQTIEDAELSMTETNQAIYCPIVNPDAEFSYAIGLPMTVFWGTGEQVPNPYYGLTAEALQAQLPFGLPEALATQIDARAEMPALEESLASDIDMKLKPIWHKSLKAWCIDHTDATFPLQVDAESGTAALPADAGNAMYIQFSPPVEADPGDPEADPPVPPTEAVDPAPWPDLSPIFDAAPGASGYSPAGAQKAAVTDTPDQVTSAGDIDAGNVLGDIGVIDAPILGEFLAPGAPPAAPEE